VKSLFRMQRRQLAMGNAGGLCECEVLFEKLSVYGLVRTDWQWAVPCDNLIYVGFLDDRIGSGA